MLNATFATEAARLFSQVPAQGPYTSAMSNSAIWVPLANLTSNAAAILAQIGALAEDSTSSSALHLPDEYDSDPTLIAGYRAQLSAIASLLTQTPSLEAAFTTGNTTAFSTLHPLSRGTVRLNLSNPLEQPIVNYRSASNPIDLTLHLAHLKYLRRTVQTRAMRALGAVETAPGEAFRSDEQLVRYLRKEITQSYMHPCCTTAMLSRAEGGAVDTNLRVHGAAGLRVVDAGVFPILPSGHLSSSVYAIAERVSQRSVIVEMWVLTEATAGCRSDCQTVDTTGSAEGGWRLWV